VNIGIANRKVFRKLCVRAEMASAYRMIGRFSRPSAVGIAAITPNASTRAQNKYHHNHKTWRSHHSNLATDGSCY
jgi:hypothetical protein